MGGVLVKEDNGNYGGLPDWDCTCGASVWPRISACFKCGARRSLVTGRDSLGYTEAKRNHREKVQAEFNKKNRRPINARFADPTNDRFRRRARGRGPQRLVSGRFAAGLDKSATPAPKVRDKIFIVQDKPIQTGGFQRGRSTQAGVGADLQSFSSYDLTVRNHKLDVSSGQLDNTQK